MDALLRHPWQSKQLYSGEGKWPFNTLLDAGVPNPVDIEDRFLFDPIWCSNTGPALQAARIVGVGLYQVNTIKIQFNNL